MIQKLKNFLIITLSIFIMAIGVYFFKFPNNFCFGGVTGAAVVFARITPLSASAFSLVVNFLLLGLGFIFSWKRICPKNNLCNGTFIGSFDGVRKIPPNGAPSFKRAYA